MAGNSDSDFETDIFPKKSVHPPWTNPKQTSDSDKNEEYDELYQDQQLVDKKMKKRKLKPRKPVVDKKSKFKEVPMLDMKQEAHSLTTVAFKSLPMHTKKLDKTSIQVAEHFALILNPLNF